MRSDAAIALIVAALLALGAGGCRERHIVGELANQTRADGSAGVSTCGAFVAGDDLHVCAASYVSGRGAETAAAVDLASDGSLIVAGADEGVDFGKPPLALLGGGAGVVYRIQQDGHVVLSLTHLGDAIADMEIDTSNGRIAVIGSPFGVASLAADASALVWSATVAAERVAAGAGLVAALGAGTVTVLDGTGTVVGRFSVTADVATASDVAVHGPSQTVLVAGFNTDAGGDQPYLGGYSISGDRRWANWGWASADAVAAGLPAPGRGVRVAVGRDGKIYFLGQSEGGDSVFTKLPHDLTQPAPNVILDEYSSTADAGNAILAYVARVDPGSGNVEVGQFLTTRDAANGNRAQDVFPGAIAADEHGTVIVGGSLDCCLDRESQKTFAGVHLVPAVPDAFVALLAVDFVSRIAWTTMGTGGAAAVVGVALAGHSGALVALQDQTESARGPLVTVAPFQPTPAGGGSDTYFAVFPTP